MAQESIFPEITVVRTPRVVRVLCECLGGASTMLGNLPAQPLASHGDHLPSWLPDGTIAEANKIIN